MKLTSILSLVRAHNLSAYVVGDAVVAETVFVDAAGVVGIERKVWAAGCSRADVLAWLGY